MFEKLRPSLSLSWGRRFFPCFIFSRSSQSSSSRSMASRRRGQDSPPRKQDFCRIRASFRSAPSVAVISAGRDNPFGHPSAEVLERRGGVKGLRTDRDAAIKITETMSGLDIMTYNEFMLEEADGPAAERRNVKRLFSRWRERRRYKWEEGRDETRYTLPQRRQV